MILTWFRHRLVIFCPYLILFLAAMAIAREVILILCGLNIETVTAKVRFFVAREKITKTKIWIWLFLLSFCKLRSRFEKSFQSARLCYANSSNSVCKKFCIMDKDKSETQIKKKKKLLHDRLYATFLIFLLFVRVL